MHAEEAFGNEIILDHRPVLADESVDVAPHQHLPKRVTIGIAGRKRVFVEGHAVLSCPETRLFAWRSASSFESNQPATRTMLALL